MARPRRSGNRTLPANLYRNGKGWRYRHPITGKFHGMGNDQARAITAAKKLNAILLAGNDLVEKVSTDSTRTVSAYIDRFEHRILKERRLAESTLYVYSRQLAEISRVIGTHQLAELTIQGLAEYLDRYEPRKHNTLRALIVDMLDEAIADGWIPDNPATHIRIRPVEKKRKRMTLEQFNAIRAEAKPWMQNAMDIGLITLQRRTDILNMQFTDIEDGYLKVIQQKTKKKTDAAYIKLKVTAPLDAVIKRCRDRIHSPLLIHDKPHRGARKSAKKIHWTQISTTKFTKEFDRARKATGMFDTAQPGTIPTFHEIRALGIKLYRDQGNDPQALAGHTNEAMTNHYDRDHDEIRWTVVDANLKF